jgi:hypothetical protein
MLSSLGQNKLSGKPQEALDCFLRTGMDILVMDSVMMSRSRATTSERFE